MTETALELKTRLTLHLATLFSGDETARMIATHAGLTLIDIDFSGSAAEVWTSIVEQAVLQKKMQSRRARDPGRRERRRPERGRGRARA